MGGRVFGNKIKPTKKKPLVKRNEMFEYDKYIEPLDPPSEVIFSIQKNQWLNSGEDMNIQKTWKGSGLFWMGLRYTNQMESMRVHNKQIPL